MRQIALAMHNYHDAHQTLPSGSRMAGDPAGGTNPRDPVWGASWIDYGSWYMLILPFIEQAGLHDLIDHDRPWAGGSHNLEARQIRVPMFGCPSDKQVQTCTTRAGQVLLTGWTAWTGSYVVNFGNTNYGQTSQDGVPFLGAPFHQQVGVKLAEIYDGTSTTLLMSEVMTSEQEQNNLIVSEITYAKGGQMFTGFLTPNSSAADRTTRACPRDPAWTRIANCVQLAGNWDRIQDNVIAARSRHPGGVNASLADGSTRFFTGDIAVNVWRALSTSQGGEPVDGN